MDPTESHAKNFLLTCFHEVAYEPEGRTCPPDFLGDGRVAIEVRRLNQHEELQNGYRGLEERAQPIWDGMIKLLASFGPPQCGKSWFVSYSFERPVSTWPKIRPKIQRKLASFLQNPQPKGAEISVTRTFKLFVNNASVEYEQIFELGICLDHNAGGCIQAELIQNLQICVNDKTNKIKRVRENYSEWWLVLVDHVSFAIGPIFADIEFLRRSVTIPTVWEKVILLSPMDHGVWKEI